MELNTALSWTRIKKDLKDRNFIKPIFIPDIIQTDLDSWLEALKVRFESANYYPNAMEVVEIPKGKGLIRPGSLLGLSDNIFYASLVQECYAKILDRIAWAQNEVDYAYIISSENLTSSDWFQNKLIGWIEFRNKSIEIIRQGFQYVIVTDITGFYENIDIPTLISDLKSCEIDREIVSNISKCLNKWCQVHGKGIPQGNSASDLLAKLYLDNVDRGMRNSGFKHLRYVDDIRIFCKNKSEAKKALIELSRLLRKRGLNLQSAKTKILTAKEAFNEIEGIQPVIETITEKINFEIFSFFNPSPYNEPEEEDDDDTPLEIIKETMNTYFINDGDENFDKTLFHFLINKLIKHKDAFALDYCLSILDKHPEETEYVLKYSKAFNENDENFLSYGVKMAEHLITFLLSDDAGYDYQNNQILEWLSENVNLSLDKILPICRKLAFDNNRPYYLRSTARNILGKYGDPSDVDRMEDCFNLSSSDIEKAELICCLKKMEKTKRNSFLGRLNGHSDIVQMAISYVKSS
jgi:hypothetical protein